MKKGYKRNQRFILKWSLFCWFLRFSNGAETSAISKKTFEIPSVQLSIPKKEIIGTRTTGAGSKRIDKSIFYKKKIKNIFSEDTLYMEMKESELLFYSTKEAVSLSHHSNKSSSNLIHDLDIKWHYPNRFSKHRIPIEGIYGVYMLPSGPHIVVIYESKNIYTSSSSSSSSSSMNNQPFMEINKIIKMEIIPIPSSQTKKPLTVVQKKEEERQLHLLRGSFKEHALYFTPLSRYKKRNILLHDDITHTLQRTYLIHEAIPNSTFFSTNQTNHKHTIDYLWSTSDARFFWNEDLIRPFLPTNDKSHTAAHTFLLRWIIPCTSAFVGIQTSIPFNTNTTYDLLLISRRSRFRAGTRFTRRGADPTGSVANFAETEQIILFKENNEIYSHVQTRGSIPLRWSSPADVKTYAPRVRIGIDPLSQARAMRRHLVEQLSLYSDSVPNKNDQIRGSDNAELVFCNLVDKKGDQGRLGRAFDSVLKAILDVYQNESIFSYGVKHIWYDFHAECKGGKWYKLKYLLDQIRPSLDSHQYFSASGNTIHSLQRGAVRTNCMDCLDRTNVVQSLFARYITFHQLYNRPAKTKTVGRNMPLEYVVAYKKDQLSLPWKKGETSHRSLWADNADIISNLYAGTNALKGDFTRTGQRTKKGMLDDGVNSVTRYYLNNFADAMRQEGYDLMTACTPFSYVQFQNLKTNQNEALTDKDHKLHLRWLPGDLKSHTISETMATKEGLDVFDDDNDSNAPYSPLESMALASIDHRAGSDRPWWAMDEDQKIMEDGSGTKSIKGININTQVSTTGRNGIMSVIGAIMASINAPNATAIAILLFLSPGL